MATILDTIADYARQRVAADKARIGPDAMRELALGGDAGGTAFEAALRRPGMRFICEVKKASPSKGLISPDFPYLDIARAYEAAQADCISCLTEPRWFLGSDGIFREIRGAVSTPMLRKDFTVDEYQIYQAKALGADAVPFSTPKPSPGIWSFAAVWVSPPWWRPTTKRRSPLPSPPAPASSA